MDEQVGLVDGERLSTGPLTERQCIGGVQRAGGAPRVAAE
jgi:hypothetical protein